MASSEYLSTTQRLTAWERRLGSAHNTEAVVSVVRDFIASWFPEDIARLPENCRPGRFKDGDDVALYAYKLLQHRLISEEVDSSVLLPMTVFFSAAVQRISEVEAYAANDCSDDVSRVSN